MSLLYCIVAYLLCATLDFYIALIYFWALIFLFDSIKMQFMREKNKENEYE